tara:strand:- start:222 stop:746 length:525 start_codon:yes stop_codon:yes gene_type:complete
MLKKPTDRTIFQNAWVVDDWEAICQKWVREIGVGPFYVGDFEIRVDYQGSPQNLSMFVAIAQAGPIQIEIIQPKNEICVYRDTVPSGTIGLHHACVWTDDIDADTEYFESIGYTTATKGQIGDIEFAYYDMRPLMGCMLEVATRSKTLLDQANLIKNSSINWDGKDPIRELVLT